MTIQIDSELSISVYISEREKVPLQSDYVCNKFQKQAFFKKKKVRI